MVTELFWKSMESPIGPLILFSTNSDLVRLYFHPEPDEGDHSFLKKHFSNYNLLKGCDLPLLHEAVKQLQEYFKGERVKFDLSIKLLGTEFQVSVWNQLLKIPYGTTTNYGAIADDIGGVARAVGTANGANPISIIVPCHRVIGADKALCGYAGGLENKELLLQLENAFYVKPQDKLF